MSGSDVDTHGMILKTTATTLERTCLAGVTGLRTMCGLSRRFTFTLTIFFDYQACKL